MPEPWPDKPLFPGRLVCVAIIDHAEDAVPLAEALLAGGLTTLEFTFRTQAAAEAIRRVRIALPEMHVGAGTILSQEQLHQAIGAGAQFGISPGVDEAVLQAAQHAQWPFLPGVMTPSDILRALNLGFTCLKIFPAEAAGGIQLLNALASPFASSGVTFVPTGGIRADNLAAYLRAPAVVAVGGSWMAERALIQARNWLDITRLTRAAMTVTQAALVS